jgi:hypothetical protein
MDIPWRLVPHLHCVASVRLTNQKVALSQHVVAISLSHWPSVYAFVPFPAVLTSLIRGIHKESVILAACVWFSRPINSGPRPCGIGGGWHNHQKLTPYLKGCPLSVGWPWLSLQQARAICLHAESSSEEQGSPLVNQQRNRTRCVITKLSFEAD